MKIASHAIKHDGGLFVIAEIGVNHDGKMSRALSLIDAAKQSGADAVKFQFFQVDHLLSKQAKLAMYQEASGATDPFEMLRDLQLSLDDLTLAIEHARQLDIAAIVTVFSLEDVAGVTLLPWDALKTASPDIVNQPLIESLTECGLPLIVSTGASTMREVNRAAAWLQPLVAEKRLAMLHCVSAYPTLPEHASLGGIVAMREQLPCPIGYSDHTQCTKTGRAAVQHGAVILEKHLTDDRHRPGPDHAASLEPRDFAIYVNAARAATLDAGTIDFNKVEKKVLDIERDVRQVARQSIVTTRNLQVGDIITRNDLTIKRPGIGIEPWQMNEIVGSRVGEAIERDAIIQPHQIHAMCPA